MRFLVATYEVKDAAYGVAYNTLALLNSSTQLTTFGLTTI